jgi:hypothetical protein
MSIREFPFLRRASALVLFFGLLSPCKGQQVTAGSVVRGVVTEEGSNIPLATAAVTLLGEAGTELQAVFTDDQGRYRLQSPGPGVFRLRAERIGYHPQEKGPFTLQATDTLHIDFRLTPSPLLLDSILVNVRRRRGTLGAGEQLIYGRLLDNEGGEPIPQGLIRLLRRSGSTAARTLTDDDGLFWLVSPSAGAYRLQAERIGYRTSTGPEINLMLGDTIGVDFYLSVEAILLAPLVVRASARRLQDRYAAGGMGDFYRRYSSYSGGGIAEFLTRDSIARYDGWPINAGQLMNRTMMMVDQYDIQSGKVSLRHGCLPAYFVNGTLQPQVPDTRTGGYPHWALMPEDLEGIEVFEHPFVPPELVVQLGGKTPCGVVSVWTRRVPEPRPDVSLWVKLLAGTGLLSLGLALGLIL